MKRLFIFSTTLLISIVGFCQQGPNVAGSTALSSNTAAGALGASTNVNYFTGIPSVSVPLYSYSGKGMQFGISADYTGGGVKVGAGASIIGLGWYLNAGGMVSRTVRGIPDDIPTYGFMNATAIPIDFRTNGNKYYYDSLDTQPDVFSFSFPGRSGQFYIGKNHQIVLAQQSKLSVQYTQDATSQLINGFTIQTENGARYVFDVCESTTQSINGGNDFYKSAYSGKKHNSAWYLSQVIAPFGTDTIKLSYTTKSLNTDFAYPAISIVLATTHAEKKLYTAGGKNSSTVIKLNSISFPDKSTVTLQYSNVYQYDDTDYAVARLKISDSVFRRGYQFNYQTSFTGSIVKYNPNTDEDTTVTATYPTNLLLKSITPYTQSQMSKGYFFIYNAPYPDFHSYSQKDSVLNAYDYWGYFNGYNNRTNAIPYIYGINNSGSMRSASAVRVTENSLSWVNMPNGGSMHYEYEQNTVRANTIQAQSISLAVTANNSSASFSQAFSTMHELSFAPLNVDRTAAAPFTGTCNVTFTVKNTTGTISYASTTMSLYDLFYQGLKKWYFQLPAKGTYRVESALSGGGTVPGGYLTQISWNNRVTGTGSISTGGIRVSRITTQTASDDPSHNLVQEFTYNTADGNSSGFLGDIPEYYYPYQETVTSTGVTTNYYVISSDPVNNLNNAQGGVVGYRHVEVYKGTVAKNMGKTVYEYTDFSDVGSNYFHATFPYAPSDIKDWGLGIPKRILTYDSSDNLIASTTNRYNFSATTYNSNGDFKGLKLGLAKTIYQTDPVSNPNTGKTNIYIGQEYFVSTGRADLSQSIDSVFYKDGSIQTNTSSYVYDSYYNVIKTTNVFDKTKGLNLETRIYYPYNYSLSSGAIKILKDSNIISQVVSTESWITGDANPRIAGATITNFIQLASKKYIVPLRVYKFQSNAPVSQSTIGVFNGASLVRNATYFVEQNYIPIYYQNGNPAQVTNIISGQNASLIYDYNNQFPIAQVSNAAFGDVAYTSFESDGSGNWTIAGSARNKTSAMTGKQSYNLTSGSVSKSGLTAATSYIITFWYKFGSGSATVNGAATTNISTHNGWGLYTITVTGVTTVTVSGTGQIDELRLHPQNANMATSTYEPMVGITSASDANNTISYTEYDSLFRVKLVRDMDRNILKRYDYSDSSSFVNMLPNWVRTGTYCHADGFGGWDSVYTDQNGNSDTYGSTMKVFQGYNGCMCTSNPQYKIVNGVCEYGIRVVTISAHIKIVNPDLTFYWIWRCTYHYEWSDGSSSGNYVEDKPDSPTSPCYVQQED
jgi:hypothetical protein